MESSFSGSSPLPIKCGRVKMVATGKLKDWTDGGKRGDVSVSGEPPGQ